MIDKNLFDGLWTCRLNGATGAGAFHVGIYDDTPTTSKITLNHFLFRLTSHSKILRVFWVFKSPYYYLIFVCWFISSERYKMIM